MKRANSQDTRTTCSSKVQFDTNTLNAEVQS
jgi:hypothetical protein